MKPAPAIPSIAYFSMEIGLESSLPTYSGGLGMLAGDTLRSAADMGLPMVGVTLLDRKGYFTQRLDPSGWQLEESAHWAPETLLEELPQRASVLVEGRRVLVRPWRYRVAGVDGQEVPVFLLDTDLPENSPFDRTLTDSLYGGDARYRLCQEVILGIGGIRILRQLGLNEIQWFHMNEGHSSLLTLELLEERTRVSGLTITPEDIQAVRLRCVFTSHTPVPAGHDQFPMELVNEVLGQREIYQMHALFCCDGVLNLTYLALNLSHYINGVAKRHGEISRLMFSRYAIDAITNGVHVGTWTSAPFAQLFDLFITDWRRDNFSLRSALGIPRDQIWDAHLQSKARLLEFIHAKAQTPMAPEALTIGFARRAASYKRGTLLFSDIERLKQIARRAGKIQVVYGGKAHPADVGGKELIREVVEMAAALKDQIPIVYLEDYDMALGQKLTAGVDLWLNTPLPPLEASGTSGMKAALNGVPSLSVLDGWWIEGCIEGVTGWSIGPPWRLKNDEGHDRSQDALSLYDKLEFAILPLFYNDRGAFTEIMRHCIALNGSFFNTQRMLQQYIQKAYFG
jgi:glycogen phosphorylase